MTHSRSSTAASRATIANLVQPARLADSHPIAARFLYSLRLVALHDRAGCDPVPELAARLGSVETTAKTLALSQTIAATWPEKIHVSRFCCSLLTHDEATIGALIESASARDRTTFDATIVGLIRPDRIHRLWEATQELVMAELRTC